ncbi:hypothetical protein HYT23_04985 [Candidatus Pacearchaeota archaeon]|nr:hypothetical protein [Candidatus Pacearchaeota archaeon]
MNSETSLKRKESSPLETIVDIGMAMFVPGGAIRLSSKLIREAEENNNLSQEDGVGYMMLGFVDFLKVGLYTYLAVKYFN